MDKKLLLFVAIFFMAFGLNLSLIVFEKPINKMIKAKEENVISPDKSKIFVWPLTSTSDGKNNARITVFTKDTNDLPMDGKKVTLSTNLGTIKAINDLTDKNGKAEFDISSNIEGIAEIKALIDNQVYINKSITVKFK